MQFQYQIRAEPPPSALLAAIPLLAAPDGPTFRVREGQTGRYTAQVVKADLVTPLPGSVLTRLTLTLYQIDEAGVTTTINARLRQNVLNQNGVTIAPSGVITWAWSAADMAVISDAPFERHVALFEWGWASGSGKKEILFIVRNLRRVS